MRWNDRFSKTLGRSNYILAVEVMRWTNGQWRLNWISRGRGSTLVTSFQGHGSVSFLGRVEAADGLSGLWHQEPLVDVLVSEASERCKEMKWYRDTFYKGSFRTWAKSVNWAKLAERILDLAIRINMVVFQMRDGSKSQHHPGTQEVHGQYNKSTALRTALKLNCFPAKLWFSAIKKQLIFYFIY